MEGKVMKSTGSWYEVVTDSESVYLCRLRGKFKLAGEKSTNPVTVGDHVVFEPEKEVENQGIITEILRRSNYIIRKSPQNPNFGHMLAANMDQAILMATMKLPKTSLGFIDRYLVTAETFRIPGVLVFNKDDLLDRKLRARQNKLIQVYTQIGYKCLVTSAIKGQGLEEFKDLLRNKVSLISGHSGVGKSTLINKIAPWVGQKIDEISTFAKKGKHTTTFAQMFKVEEDSFIIDTPGIKELGLLEVGDEELSHYFPEMRKLFGQCKYYNCSHTHEPGCAIEEALENGRIAPSRYGSYLSMLEGEDNRR